MYIHVSKLIVFPNLPSISEVFASPKLKSIQFEKHVQTSSIHKIGNKNLGTFAKVHGFHRNTAHRGTFLRDLRDLVGHISR